MPYQESRAVRADRKTLEMAYAIPDVKPVKELFAVLADETRLRILYILTDGETCVCDITRALGCTISNTFHHLRVLREARLISSRRKGKHILYKLDDKHVLGLIREGFQHAAHTSRE
ncbi:ArsR/SmtB family transcription factor [Desulforudis sp. DRI-14]